MAPMPQPASAKAWPQNRVIRLFRATAPEGERLIRMRTWRSKAQRYKSALPSHLPGTSLTRCINFSGNLTRTWAGKKQQENQANSQMKTDVTLRQRTKMCQSWEPVKS